ncbi:hypothetical protein [Paraburkholderia graminis]|uniref:hypothetical protein n=1 Tax=Paraburkholderia graminis TaxID=60548 RepID=UPI0038B9A835
MIALLGGDIAKACERLAVVGSGLQNAVKQACRIVEPTGLQVRLRGGENVFSIVTHYAGHQASAICPKIVEAHCTESRLAGLTSDASGWLPPDSAEIHPVRHRF